MLYGMFGQSPVDIESKLRRIGDMSLSVEIYWNVSRLGYEFSAALQPTPVFA